jgi:hypothetical protein
VLQGLIAFVIYLVVFIWAFGHPLLPHLNVPKVGQTEVDPNFYIWAIRWWPYAIAHGLNPLFSHQINAPIGYNLAWATTTPALSLLLWPVTAVFGPIAAFNLTLLLAPPASAWTTFILTRRLTSQFWPALFAGPVFGFCVYELDHDVSGQANLVMTLLLPLIAYIALLWWEGRLKRTGFLIWMTLALAAEFYTFVEAFTEVTILSVVALVLGFVVAGRAAWPKVARLAVLTAIAYIGAAVLAAPYLYFALRKIPSGLTRQLPRFSTDLAGLIVPRDDRLLGMNWLLPTAGHTISSASYVGIPLLLVLLGLAVFNWSNRLVRLLVPSFVVTVALAVGPDLYIDGHLVGAVPWSGMWSLPLLESAEPMRFIDFGYLVLAIALALWLAQVLKSPLLRSARWALGVLALAAIFANLPTFAEVVVPPPPRPQGWKQAIPSLPMTDNVPTFFANGLYKQYLKPGENVVVLSHRGNAGMMFQAYTGFYFNLDGGFINASLSSSDAIPYDVELLSHATKARVAGFEAYIKSAHVGALLVERAYSEHWMYVFGKLGMKTTTVGGMTVFQVPSS